MSNVRAAALVILVLAALPYQSLAASGVDKYKPNAWAGVSWDDVNKDNIGTRFLRNLLWFSSGSVDSEVDADVYGWYKGLYFGLASWERDICLLDLSTQVRSFRDKASTADGSSEYYTTTITASAIKTTFLNTSYYEVSWFIQPFGNDALYKVYLSEGSTKEYIAGRNGNNDASYARASRNFGASGYQVVESSRVYTEIMLEYKYAGSSETRLFKSKVVDKLE